MFNPFFSHIGAQIYEILHISLDRLLREIDPTSDLTAAEIRECCRNTAVSYSYVFRMI